MGLCLSTQQASEGAQTGEEQLEPRRAAGSPGRRRLWAVMLPRPRLLYGLPGFPHV